MALLKEPTASSSSTSLNVATLPDSMIWEPANQVEMDDPLLPPFFASLSVHPISKPWLAQTAGSNNFVMADKRNQDGPFAPLVMKLKDKMGDQSFNHLRGKVISLHTFVIRSFVGASDSHIGESVLRALFMVVGISMRWN